MSDKQFILKTFKNEFSEYFKFIKKNFKFEKSEIRYMENIINLFVKFNSVKLIQIWFTYFSIPYGNSILEGNLKYFIDKDYNSEIKLFEQEENLNYLLTVIEKTKKELLALDESLKKECVNHLQNLTKLSIMYFK
jgi:hypothetical protein